MAWRFCSAKLEGAYLGCMAAVALVHMIVGFRVMESTGLSNSVPPRVAFLFRCCFHVLMFYSISRAFMHFVIRATGARHVSAAGNDDYYCKFTWHDIVLFLLSCSSVGIGAFSAGGAYVFHIPLVLFLCYRRTCSPRDVDAGPDDLFSPTGRLGMMVRNNQEIVKIIKFALGLTGTILFQNYFKLTSFDEIMAFVFLQVSWLSGITLIPVSDDFGVLNFLLTNVTVGSAVAEAGLGPHTWLAFIAALFLYAWRLELRQIHTSNA